MGIVDLGYGTASRAKAGINAKRIAVIIAIFAIVFICIAIYVVGDFGTGYKFTVSGKVTLRGPLEGSGWEITDIETSTPKRDWNVLSTLWSWPWESDMTFIIGTSNNYEVKQDLGNFATTGQTKPFSLEFRHFDPGHYTITLEVVERACGIIPINCDQVVKVVESTSINIVGE